MVLDTVKAVDKLNLKREDNKFENKAYRGRVENGLRTGEI